LLRNSIINDLFITRLKNQVTNCKNRLPQGNFKKRRISQVNLIKILLACVRLVIGDITCYDKWIIIIYKNCKNRSPQGYDFLEKVWSVNFMSKQISQSFFLISYNKFMQTRGGNIIFIDDYIIYCYIYLLRRKNKTP
jgi:hypothetical protein